MLAKHAIIIAQDDAKELYEFIFEKLIRAHPLAFYTEFNADSTCEGRVRALDALLEAKRDAEDIT